MRGDTCTVLHIVGSTRIAGHTRYFKLHLAFKGFQASPRRHTVLLLARSTFYIRSANMLST